MTTARNERQLSKKDTDRHVNTRAITGALVPTLSRSVCTYLAGTYVMHHGPEDEPGPPT